MPLVIAIIAIPAALAGASLLIPSRIMRPVTAAGGIATALCIGILAYERSHGGTAVDALSALFLLPVGIVYGTVGLYTVWYVRVESEHNGEGERFAREFLAFTNAFACAEAIVPLTTNMAGLWVAVEVTTIVAALLVRLQGTEAALEAAWKYILIASCGLAIGLIGVVLLFLSGTAVLGMHHDPNWSAYIGVARRLDPDAVRLAFVLALIGFGTKMGLAPMHTWLPDAHGAGPTPTSAMLSGVLLSDALYVILRFTGIANAAVGPVFTQRLFIAIGLFSLLVGAFFLLQQRDIKRMLAYSSIEHMGVVAAGLGFGAPIAVAGALLHAVNHSASKSLAFYGAGRLAERFQTREIQGIRSGIETLPYSGTLFALAGLSLAGLPPFGIFRSELMILAGGFQSSRWGWTCLMLALLIVAFAGIARWVTMTAGAEPGPTEVVRGERPSIAIVAMLLGFVVVLGLGLFVPHTLAVLLDSAAREIGGSL